MENSKTDKINKKPYKKNYKKKFDKPKDDSPDKLTEKFNDIVIITEKTNINHAPKKLDIPYEHKSIPKGLAQKLSPTKNKHFAGKSADDQGTKAKKDLNTKPTQHNRSPSKTQFVNDNAKKTPFVPKTPNHKKQNSVNEKKPYEPKKTPVILNSDKNELGQSENTQRRKSHPKFKKSFGSNDKEGSKPFKHNTHAKTMKGDEKSCPYLNRMKNTKEEEFSESIEFEDDTKRASEATVIEPKTPPNLLMPVESNDDGKDLLNSILNGSFTEIDSLLLKPTNIVDINEINCDFEAPKLTENTSTVLMSNAEIEILNKRQMAKHPDDDGGPYVLKLTNLQKGFNSDNIIKEVLKPKGILYVRTKFFWEPNFKASFDEMKKMCFLEVKYFEEIDRCIQILKRNSFLIKAEKCKHDDFVKISKLQNSQWGDPEFVNKADLLSYKILKYKINLVGEPVGILREGEQEISSPEKLPSLPTLGSLPKKNESVFLYSEMADKIVKNKQKTKEQEEAIKSNSSSVINSPLSAAGHILTSANLNSDVSEKKQPRSNSSSTYTGSENNGASSSGHKGGWNKDYTKSSGKISPNDGYKKYGGKTHTGGSGSGNKPRSNFSGYNSPKMSDRKTPTSDSPIGYGFAASFGRNSGP